MGFPLRVRGINASRIDTKDSIALAMSLYFLLSRRRFGAEFVLCAERKLMMLIEGRPIIRESPGSRYNFCHGSNCVWLSPGYLSNIISVRPVRRIFRVTKSTFLLIFTTLTFLTFHN